jgi:hypothetical protein
MIQKVIFRQPAVEDVVEAAAWYEAHAPGLGEQLIDEILSATRRAHDDPGPIPHCSSRWELSPVIEAMLIVD